MIAKRENPPEQVYNLVLRNHREVRATANHPFLVARKVGRTRQLAWTSLASIVPGDEFAIVRPVPDRGQPHRLRSDPPDGRTPKPVHGRRETTDDLMWSWASTSAMAT